MIRKSGNRFSEKIMLKQKEAVQVWFNPVNQTWPADKAGQQKAKPK